MPPTYATTEDARPWAECVGGLILNFGALEFQTLYWIQVLLGEDQALAYRKKTLSERILTAKTAFLDSAASNQSKMAAEALWDEIKAHTKLRNRIAHNPMCAGRDSVSGELVWSVIELKKMEPSADNAHERLDFREIQRVALRVRDINNDLNELLQDLADVDQG